MGSDVIVAGTGFSNPNGDDRASIIRKHCKPGMKVRLVRERNNPHDKNAIAVHISAPRLFGILGNSYVQIGYIKASTAVSLAKKIDSGIIVTGKIKSIYAPAGRDHPQVSLKLEHVDT